MKTRLCRRSILLTAALALLALSSSASALIITGGPTYTLPGGGSCSVASVPSVSSGATVTCTGVSLASHTRVYFGIKNDTNANGAATDGSGPTGAELFTATTSSGADPRVVAVGIQHNFLKIEQPMFKHGNLRLILGFG